MGLFLSVKKILNNFLIVTKVYFIYFFIFFLGGSLFSQQQNDDLIELSVHAEGITFIAKTGGKTYEHKIMGNFLDNKWHTVYLQYRLGNLTIDVEGEVQVNSVYKSLA